MRLLSPLCALLFLALAGAGSGSIAPADQEIIERIEAGEIARATELALALIGREAAEPDGSPARLADHLRSLAERFYAAGTRESIATARQFYEHALSLREPRADEEPGPHADLLHDLSSLYFNNGEYDAALSSERRALEIRSRIYPPGDPRTAESQSDLGLILLSQGRLKEASSYLADSLKTLETVEPRDWKKVAVGREYLAELYRLEGRYADAARILEDLVSQAPDNLSTDDPEFFYLLNNLAGVYRDQDRLDEAETLLRRSLTLRQQAVPRDDGAVARATLNLAELYRAQGKPAESETLYVEALDLARRTLGAGSPELFEFINQIAVLYRETGRFQSAERRFREALELVEKGLGPDSLRAAQSRLDLAELLAARGHCDDADAHYRRAAAIRQRALGPDHPDLAEVLTEHAQCLALTPSRRDTARESLDAAIRILGGSEAHSPVAVEALALRADLVHKADPAAGNRDLASALSLVESMRPHRGGGEGVRAEFFGRYARLYERLVRWEIEAKEPDRALVSAERGRARALLDQLAAAHVGDAAPLPPDLVTRQSAARAELAEIHERMKFEQSRADLNAAERLARVGALEQKLEEATRSFRELYDEAKNADASWRGVAAGEPASVSEIQQGVVPRDGLMVLYEIGGEGSYVFSVPPAPGPIEARPLVVGADDASTLGVEPGPLTEGKLSRILSGAAASGDKSASPGIIAHLSAPQGSPSRGIGGLSVDSDPQIEKLFALWRVLVPGALWPRLVLARELLVIPDGPLFLLPFEALVVRPGQDPRATRFWLDEGPVVRYAASATFVRDLGGRIRTPGGHEARATALSVSDPVYDPRDRRAGPSPAPPGSRTSRGAYLGGGRILPRLPGTAVETREVRAALAAVADVAVLSGAAARESAVRNEIVGKRYVHIATHGLVDEERGELFAALALTPPPSGVPSGDDDGFLQLFEIYGMKLDAELAVLSSCSSNTGKVVAGEGIFALSRGFLVAGARRVIASQWPVDDHSTAELVGELFRRIASAEKNGERIDPALALRDAKRRVRRARAEWAHPFFWAPFVISGAE